MLTNLILGIMLLAGIVAWYAWTHDKLHSHVVSRGFEGKEVLRQGDEQTLHQISKDFAIEYTRQTYLNIPFELLVRFTKVGQIRLSGSQSIVREGHVEFEATESEPIVKVELLFDEDAFEANETSQEKVLKVDDETVFSFWLKPLKSENSLLTVTISYVHEEEIAEKLAQIQITTVEKNGVKQETATTEIKTPATVQMVNQKLDQATLNVSVVTFLGLNTWELSFLGKGLGALLAVVIVTISFVTGRNFDWLEVIELLLLGIAAPLGISFYDGLEGRLKLPVPENSK